MAYTGPAFWLFLGAVLSGFAALAPSRRPGWLLLASLAFAAGFGWPSLAGLGFVLVVALLTLRGMSGAAHARGRRRWAGLGCAVLVLALVALKFGAVLPGLDRLGLANPPGYSFYSFAAIALVIDAVRDPVPPGPAALHLAWFPKLLAGPIERAGHLVPQIGAGLRLDPEAARIGAVLVLGGLVKKLVVADNLAPVVDAAYAIPDYAAPLDLLVATYFFAFQIYCDFSGYSDIAAGLSLPFGLVLVRNFRRPYLSPSIGAFWSGRWHASLAAWFRDYVFIPLGGSRRGRVRTALNLLAVFGLSGLWHAGLGYGVGWGFLAWGLVNGAFVAVERALPRAPAHPVATLLRTLLTFHLVLVGWVFFRASDLGDGLTVLRRIAEGLPDVPRILAAYPFTADQRLGAVLILALLAVEVAAGPEPVHRRLHGWPLPLRWAALYVGAALLLVLGRWQGEGFLYMRF